LTEYFIKDLDVDKYSGNILAKTTGSYCFTWERNRPYPDDWQLNLNYHLDEIKSAEKNK